MTGWIEFVEPGIGVTIQDAGRVGHRAIGVPLAGAADLVLLACANGLLGQAADAAALEVALVGPTLRAHGKPVRLALAGDFAPSLTRDGGSTSPCGSWRSLTLHPGQTLAVGPCRTGLGYVALAGGADVPTVLGSRSTYVRAGLGGIQGRAPRAGDRLNCGGGAGIERRSPKPFAHADGPIRVLPGPQDDHFDADAWTLFTGSGWRVTREADRMGLRLDGPRLAHRADRGADVVSEAVVPGAIQVPGDGRPIVLGVDAQTIGGYAKIATVIRADLSPLAHARPGKVLRFQVVTRDEALAARRALAAALDGWLARLEPVLPAGEPDETVLHTGNLISGMIDACANLPWDDTDR